MRPIERWITDNQLASIYSSKYWNDLEEEKKKEWWIANGNYQKCLDFLRKSGLFDEYKAAEQHIMSHLGMPLKVADLAAGTGWASA